MKLTRLSAVVFPLLLALWVLGGCAGSSPSVEGVWAKMLPEPQADEAPAIKILTDGHFAFGQQVAQGHQAWSGGGTYVQDEEKYTETITYHSVPSLVGQTIEFTCVFRDGLWYHEAEFTVAGEHFLIAEVWKRLE